MGIFRRLFPRQSETNRVLTAIDYCSGDFHQAIVGEASYQEELRRVAAGRTERGERVEFRAVLVPEPQNKYDRNAVAVFAEGGSVIGYLDRELAAEYQPLILEHVRLKRSHPCCKAVMAGGQKGKPSIGVWLDIDWDALEEAC
jgi:hypothetical protein